MQTLQVFRYIGELDAFVVAEEFAGLMDMLGLTEWHPAVWVGRLFTLDSDYGEHWLDNWDERDALTGKAGALSIDPVRLDDCRAWEMQDRRDDPCYPDALRKAFWTDVLKFLRLGHDVIFAAAREMNENCRERVPEDFLPDLEARIDAVRQEGRG